MATTPPTSAQVDAWADTQVDTTRQLLLQAVAAPGTPIQACVVGWTRNDATQEFIQIADPTTDEQAAAICRGLVASYGAITVVVYTFTWTEIPYAQLEAPAAIQTTYNDPANWAAP